jgi:hypothetical protein
VPQAFNVVPVWHLPEVSQQPVGQVVALHALTLQIPDMQLSPDGHTMHEPPPVPHAAFVTPGWQTPAPSQHPLGQVIGLQAGPVHTPPVQLSLGGHVAHAAPPDPQNPVVVPGSHSPDLSQQPVGQLEALHGGGWQLPALQLSPAGQATHEAPPVPHAPGVVPTSQKPSESQHPVGHVAELQPAPVHFPPEQESPDGHGKHADPPVPHADVLVPDSHLPALSQQPVGQLVELHVAPWHEPVTHVSPTGHTEQDAPPVPHAPLTVPGWQVPSRRSQQPVGHVEALQGGGWQTPALQLSPDGHEAHVKPPVPHAPGLVPVSQKPSASQQPVGQDFGPHATPMQTPVRHESPAGHGTHAEPPTPHAEVLVPDSQRPALSQQPIGQVIGLHVAPTHAPIVHTSPTGQSAHDSPPMPQAAVLVPSWQVPVVSQHPVGQVAALQGEGLQVPLEQVSPLGQDTHEVPPVPHAIGLVPVSQKPRASQQPVGQVFASQVVPMHTPLVQVSPGGQGRHALPPVPHAEVLVPVSHLPRLSQHPEGQVDALQVVP